jgi:pyruvate dehydrogenase E1 component beta subunit
MSELTLAGALTDALATALDKDLRVLVIGEDVGLTGGVFRITDGLIDRFGDQRVIDTPVAESGIVGAAFGMAIAGLRPVAEIQFMGFSYPAYDQILSHVARIRNRSQHRFSAPMVIRMPCGGGFGAAEHHSESTEAIYAHIPGLKVVIPATPYDAKGLLLAAIDSPDPVIFLEPIRLYRLVREEVPEGYYTVEIGKARIETEGTDVSIITWGAMTHEVREAVEALAADGISAEMIDLRTLRPLDEDTIIESVQKTGRAVVVQEAPKTAGFGAEIAALIGERALYSLQAPVERVAGWDTTIPLKKAEHRYMPTTEAIVAAARRTMDA